MSFAFGGVFACFFPHFHQLMITDSGKNLKMNILTMYAPKYIYAILLLITTSFIIFSI